MSEDTHGSETDPIKIRERKKRSKSYHKLISHKKYCHLMRLRECYTALNPNPQ